MTGLFAISNSALYENRNNATIAQLAERCPAKANVIDANSIGCSKIMVRPITKEDLQELKKTIDSWSLPIKHRQIIMNIFDYEDMLEWSNDYIDQATVIINNDKKKIKHLHSASLYQSLK